MPEPPPVRPEVVQTLYDALTDMNPAKLAALAAIGVTPAERAAAESLWLASMLAASDHRARVAEAWSRLIVRRWPKGVTPSWSDLFDDLTPDRVQRLGELYDALPDGARQEYERRYGRPGGAG